MKQNFLYSLVALMALISCSKVDREYVPWSWNSEISPDGGFAIWEPAVCDAHFFPTIQGVSISFYDSQENRISGEKLDNVSSDLLEGEWYKIETSLNTIKITVKANDTQYTRQICAGFEGAGNIGGLPVSIIQRPK